MPEIIELGNQRRVTVGERGRFLFGPGCRLFGLLGPSSRLSVQRDQVVPGGEFAVQGRTRVRRSERSSGYPILGPTGEVVLASVEGALRFAQAIVQLHPCFR